MTAMSIVLYSKRREATSRSRTETSSTTLRAAAAPKVVSRGLADCYLRNDSCSSSLLLV